jgi:hypothetical protein
MERIMNALTLKMSPLFVLAACSNQEQAPVNITNEINNEITVDNGCCGCEDEDPCAEDEDPCAGDDTGEPGDTGEPDPVYEDVFEVTEYRLDLEVNQVDVTFLVDTTGSMSSTANAMASEFGDIVDELAVSIPDGAYGYGTFDDYNYEGLGGSVDRPFILQQQVTTDQVPVQAALDATTIHYGADTPESSIEGLFQALTGYGYDQTADGVLDPDTDVPPFIASPDDVFSGAVPGIDDPSTVGGGQIGGFGFRDGSLPVIVYATDAYLRDPDAGYTVPPDASYAAGSDDVIDEATDLGARLIGVSTGSGLGLAQMTDLAVATDSLYEADADGLVDDPLVFSWAGSSSAFRSTIVEAIEGMLENVTFSSVTAVVTGNVYGFTTSVSPASYSSVTVGSTPVLLDFGVEISGSVAASTVDQTFPLTLEIYGDGTTLLGTQDLTFTVPASL